MGTSSEVESTAVNMRGMSCPRSGPAMPVSVMQNTLKKYGVPPSPLEKFALTAYAATRDVSMRAQAKEEFSKLDHETQAKLKKLGKEVVVRAASIDPEDLAGVTEDPEELKVLENKELNNGRLAMVSAAGMIAQELVTGKNI